jgi:hypothetical protein
MIQNKKENVFTYTYIEAASLSTSQEYQFIGQRSRLMRWYSLIEKKCPILTNRDMNFDTGSRPKLCDFLRQFLI